MAETEQITVATTSAGPGGTGEPGETVNLPVVELLTGRGFITGKSGSGKSNTASVIAEKLLDNGFGLLIVDIDGEYYGLKEEYEILHVGGDEECDIQVTEDHAGKIASLALEQNVPIILDISSFLDEEEAETLLTEVAKQLFAKAKKQKQPFLMLVEECHEWMPEKGSMGEVGKMLIKIGKRGRKHGLGIVGISQRPADVKKDYITQCDWLVWHRLTWNNDTKVVGRILDNKYADAVEDLDDGEAFMMNDWAEQVSRVQFHRKQTFDAGATPGLDDFERPELKSVSDDLVSELETISDEQQETEDRIKELREELDKKNSRIAELEAELQDARDLSRMAEQFTEAMVEQAEDYNPGRTEQEKMRRQRERFAEPSTSDGDADTSDEADGDADTDDEADADGPRDEQPPEPDETADATSGGGFGDAFSAFAEDGAVMNGGSTDEGAATNASSADAEPASNGHAENAAVATNGDSPDSSAAAVPVNGRTETDTAEADDDALRAAIAEAVEAEQSAEATEAVEDETPSDVDGPAADLRADIEELDRKTCRMLAYYREQGPGTPLNAHFSAGGSGDRTAAYARNRELRLRGLVEHVGRGKYDARLAALVREESDRGLDDEEVESVVSRLESAFLDGDSD
ncbi:helicase HerA domain-containing protein [Haloarcula rubripromontorii]|uniref:helicase HerA domain-containing protein n=1 Tax=Haloarcula rubripromontorii TaxID=1705562 RepID=UPI00345C0E33